MKIKKHTIKIISPAKVNLFLAVAEKQSGFHPVLNVMHSLLLHDVLFMDYQPAEKLQVNIEFLENEDSNGEIPTIKLEDNLVYKAIVELAKTTKRSNYKIDVYIEKNIPLQAGLAGGSSNAAAALVGASKIFGIKDEDKVNSIAAEIGSDVAFFLRGGCALYTGRGQILDHKIQPINRDVILIRPFNDNGLSTKKVYEEFDKLGVFSNFNEKFQDDMSLMDATRQLQFADNIPLLNNLAIAAENLNPDLCEIKDWLIEKVGKDNVLLSGSGSTTFAIIEDADKVDEIIHEAKHKGFWAISTQLANVKARMVPNVTEY